VVDCDEFLVVGNDLRRAAGIGQEIQLDLSTKQAPIFVDGVGPELVPLLEGLAITRKVARE